MSAPLLELRGVSLSFGELRVLEGVELRVEPGELVVVVGPSGGGKTSLLRVAAGLQRPDAGQVLFRGEPVEGPPPGLQLVFQHYEQSLFPWLTVAGNLRLALLGAGVPPAEREERLREALRLVRLEERAGAWPSELSGGMAQRVAIARALSVRPDLLCMDEPFGALDAATRRALQDELLAIPSRPAVLFVTHDVDEALYLADRVLVQRPGLPLMELRPGIPRPRNQIETPALPAFQAARARLLRVLEEA